MTSAKSGAISSRKLLTSLRAWLLSDSSWECLRLARVATVTSTGIASTLWLRSTPLTASGYRQLRAGRGHPPAAGGPKPPHFNT
ncbi:hypothetical protein AUL38_11835 [Leucobacter sp. G161]|nr:hypothetical protein AUL38_11835 [Leucobacter sp. G161]